MAALAQIGLIRMPKNGNSTPAATGTRQVVDEGEEQVLPDVPIVARLSRRARAMARRSPLTSVTPALSIATSVPVPIAMPTWAWARAGASLMPSPAIATTRPSAWRFLIVSLFCWQHLGDHFIDAQLPRHGLGRAPAVAGQHDDPQSVLVEQANGFRGRVLDRVGDADQPGKAAVDFHQHHRLALRRAAPRAGPAVRRRDPLLGQQGRVAQDDLAALDGPTTPLPVTDWKSCAVGTASAVLRPP